MKFYEKVLNQLEIDVSNDKQLAGDLIIDVTLWKEFKLNNREQIMVALQELKKEYPQISKEYVYFLKNYYCPVLGDFDIYVPYADKECEDCTIITNWRETRNKFPSLLPIANFDHGDYIYLNEKGEVIQFVGIGKETPPEDFFTEVPDEDYEVGFDIAYLTYPDSDGLYRMYEVLGRSFDEFMNECVFGDRYPEFTDKEDNFYWHVKKIRESLGL